MADCIGGPGIVICEGCKYVNDKQGCKEHARMAGTEVRNCKRVCNTSNTPPKTEANHKMILKNNGEYEMVECEPYRLSTRNKY